MLIYRDLLNDDEVCSDSYPTKFLYDGAIMEVSGQNIRVDGGIDDALIGGNASAEDGAIGTDDAAATGINVVMTHNLVETQFDKKSFKAFIKEYFKKVMTILKDEGKDDELKVFKKGAQEAMKFILDSFKDWMFYTGESMDPEAGLVLGNYREDGLTPYFWYFKHALKEEKF